jgi:hypothetical protein
MIYSLDMTKMDAIIPWQELSEVIAPYQSLEQS